MLPTLGENSGLAASLTGRLVNDKTSSRDMSSGAIDVLVVGGGPAGMAAGISFGRAGLRTLVCERGWLPADKPCGEGVMPTGLAYLERLGVSAYLDHDHTRPFSRHPLSVNLRGGRIRPVCRRAGTGYSPHRALACLL